MIIYLAKLRSLTEAGFMHRVPIIKKYEDGKLFEIKHGREAWEGEFSISKKDIFQTTRTGSSLFTEQTCRIFMIGIVFDAPWPCLAPLLFKTSCPPNLRVDWYKVVSHQLGGRGQRLQSWSKCRTWMKTCMMRKKTMIWWVIAARLVDKCWEGHNVMPLPC